MSKLSSSLQHLARKDKAPVPVESPAQPDVNVDESAQKSKALKTSQQSRRPSRTGTKAISGHFDPTVSRQLKQIALDEDSSVQELLGEALNLLFESRGLPQIAPKQND